MITFTKRESNDLEDAFVKDISTATKTSATLSESKLSWRFVDQGGNEHFIDREMLHPKTASDLDSVRAFMNNEISWMLKRQRQRRN